MAQDVLARNNVTVFGTGSQPMLFAHGFGCDQTMWRFVAPAFADAYRIVLFDYVGAGKSDIQAFDVDRYGSLDGYAQDVLDICAALNLTNVILVGHSISGMIGLLASLRAPALFSRLILIGSSPHYINEPPHYIGGFARSAIEELLDLMEKNYGGWASFLAPAVMKNSGRPELARELEESFRAIDPVIARHFAEVTFFTDNRRDLPLASVPSLILQCSDDLIVPIEVGDYLHQHLPASTLRRMQAVGHYPHLSNPEETIQLLQDYLTTTPVR